jgi:Ca-activated chloride channel family protein
MPKRPNLYALLGLLRSANPEEIRRAYLKAAKKLHPDANVAPGETEIFLDVQQAYQILSDPQRRAAYDAALPPDEKPEPAPIQYQVQASRNELFPNVENQLVYTLFDFAPTEEYKKNAGTPPLNLCLVLDTSTSMKGDKLDTVKSTAVQLMRRLRPEDIFSVVSFSDNAEVIIPATRQSSPQRAEMKIHMMQASGATEILHGLQAGLDEVRRYNNPNFINHIILLTDGRTYGDEPSCYQLGKNAAEEGIGISGLGIGSGWNDVFLDHLAQLTGGNSMFVAHAQDIERLLTEKFNHLSRALVETVTLHFEEHPNTRIQYAFRLQPETSPLELQDSCMVLGPILHDWPLTVMLELVVSRPAQAGNTCTLLKGYAELNSASFPIPLQPIPFEIALPVSGQLKPETPPPAIVQALSKLTLYRIQEKARQAVDSGDYERATQHLQRLATHLLAQGERGLAHTILLEVEHIEQKKAFSDTGDKQIKYGTRALLLPKGRKT